MIRGVFGSWSWLRDRRLIATALGIVAIVAVMNALEQGHPVCSVAAPCKPSRFGSASFGLFAGSIAVIYVHRRVAAWLAAAATATLMIADFLDPTLPTWGYLVVAGYLAGFWYLLAPLTCPPVANSAVVDWAAFDRQVLLPDCGTPPRPQSIPVLAKVRLVTAAVLIAATVVLTWNVLLEQDRRNTERQAAWQIGGVVQRYPDEFTVHVQLDDRRELDIGVQDAKDYPIGERMAFYTDGHRLVQPLSEPYDATGWLMLAGLLASIGVAVGTVAVTANIELRRLLTRATQIRRLPAVEYDDRIYLHLPSRSPGHLPVITVPVLGEARPRAGLAHTDLGSGTDLGTDADLGSDADRNDLEPDSIDFVELVAESAAQPALVFGNPTSGNWCAVLIDGRLRLPRAAACDLDDIPIDPVTGDLAPLTDEPQLDQSTLCSYDRDVPPEVQREHRLHPLVSWFKVIGTVVAVDVTLGVAAVRAFAPCQLSTSLAIAATASAIAMAYARHTHLRSAVRWNASGLVAVLDGRTIDLPWSPTTIIYPDGGHVIVADLEHETIMIPARRRTVVPPAAPGERSVTQLADGLRLARRQGIEAADSVTPPTPPSSPQALSVMIAVWVVLSTIATVALDWASRVS